MANDQEPSGQVVNDQVVRRIRERFDMTQTELAAALDVTFATVNRWENAKTTPPPSMREKLGEFCKARGVRLEEFTGNKVESGKGTLMLFCLAEKGLSGSLTPESLDNCDLGFSMCASEAHLQQMKDVYGEGDELALYSVTLDTRELRLFYFGSVLDFLLYEAAREKRLSKEKYSALYDRYAGMAKKCDIVVGYEKNEMLLEMEKRFFIEQLTDVALMKAAEKLSLPQRYIAISDEGKKAILIKKEIKGDAADAKDASTAVAKRGRPKTNPENTESDSGKVMKEKLEKEIEDILRSNRREGLYLDELEQKEKLRLGKQIATNG